MKLFAPRAALAFGAARDGRSVPGAAAATAAGGTPHAKGVPRPSLIAKKSLPLKIAQLDFCRFWSRESRELSRIRSRFMAGFVFREFGSLRAACVDDDISVLSLHSRRFA